MKKIMAAFLMVLFIFCMFSNANAGFTVTWDENVPAPTGYKIFERTADESYDYSNPYWTGALPPVDINDMLPPLPDMLSPTNISGTWNKETSSITIDWNQPASATSTDTFYMIVRAYMEADPDLGTPELQSADSEEVSIEQTNTNDVTEWEVYYSETSGGPYTSLGKTPAEGNTRITEPLTVVPVGQAKIIYFVVVAFGQEETHSPDSDEVAVLVDRRTLTPPVNIKVTVTVPVQ